MSHEHSQEVLNDFEKLLTTEIGYGVIIYAGENENIKELLVSYCFQVILSKIKITNN